MVQRGENNGRWQWKIKEQRDKGAGTDTRTVTGTGAVVGLRDPQRAETEDTTLGHPDRIAV